MNCLKRALLSIKKHKVKNILLAASFTVIAAMLFSSIAVFSAVNNVQEKALHDVGTQVKITFDNSKGEKIVLSSNKSKGESADTSNEISGNLVKPISGNTLKQLSSLEHVAAYNHLSIISNALATNFSPIWKKSDAPQVFNDEEMKKYKLGDEYVKRECLIKIITNGNLLDEFSSGTYKIIKGRNITKNDAGKFVAVINQNIAEKNGLTLNSKISFQALFDDKVNQTYTIVGIYKAPPVASNMEGLVGSDQSDTIYTPFNSAISLLSDSNDPTYTPDLNGADSAIYYLDSPENVNSFIAAAKKVPGMEDFILTADTSLYTRVTSSLKSATKLSLLMTIIMLAAGCLILALIIALSLKGRRREFGILLAVGERRLCIILQVLAETLIPMAVAFCIAVFVSGFITQKVTDKLVTDSVTAVQQQDKINSTDLAYIQKKTDKIMETGDLSDFDTDLASPVSKVNVTVTPAVVGEFAGCGLLIVLLSILFPAVKVLRLSPMVILTKKE